MQQVEQDNDERSSIPITVRCVSHGVNLDFDRGADCWNLFFGRQLEAIIRISEALAKLTLSPVVQNHHVDEAIRLFKFSTMDAVSAGPVDGMTRGQLNEEMNKIEKEIRRRLPIGWSTSYQSLVKEFVNQQGYTSHALERTMFVMEKREVLRFSNQASVRTDPSNEACFNPVGLHGVNRRRWCTGTATGCIIIGGRNDANRSSQSRVGV